MPPTRISSLDPQKQKHKGFNQPRPHLWQPTPNLQLYPIQLNSQRTVSWSLTFFGLLVHQISSPLILLIMMQISPRQKSSKRTAATVDLQLTLDSGESEQEKRQPHRNALMLLYSLVMVGLTVYFCGKHSRRWKRWAVAVGVGNYLFMKLGHCQHDTHLN